MPDREFKTAAGPGVRPSPQGPGRQPVPLTARGTLPPQGDPLAALTDRAADASPAGAHSALASRAAGPQAAPVQRSLLRLQRQYGNRYVQRVLALARQGEGEGTVAPEVEDSIQRERGGGQALDGEVRARMESAFGVDFGDVRVHTDAEADALNRAVSARAFTSGQDIFFRQGEYSPGSSQGRELLAHELTHVVQQTGATIGRKLTVNQPGDVYEQEAEQVARAVVWQEQQAASQGRDRGSIRPQATATAGARPGLRLQRLTVPLVGWGDVPRFADSSSMEIQPRATLWVNGRPTERRSFAGGPRDRMTIPLNTDAHLQVAANVQVERDDPLANDTNEWSIEFTWRVRVDDRGRVTLYPPTPNWTGGTGDAPWSLVASPVQGEQSVGIALTLGSTESTSTGHSISIGGELSAEPAGVGAAGTGGYSYSWGTSTGSTLTAGRGFVLDIETPRPPPQVEIGPITEIRRYEYYFATGRATLGTNPRTGVDENIRLTGFLMSLDPQGEGGRNIRGFVDGYASPAGDTEFNRTLARRRADYILRRIRDTLPQANFDIRVYGEDIWREQGVPDVDNSEKHRVVLLQVRRTTEVQ